MKLALIRTFVAATCLTVVGTGSAFADQIFVTIHGAKTPFPKLTATGFSSQVLSPRDAATGQATGKRIHKPFVITKDWGTASAELFQALATDEVLRTVEIDVLKTTAQGTEAVFEKIVLTNAVITDLKRNGTLGKPTLEEITLVYQKSEIQYLFNKSVEFDE